MIQLPEQRSANSGVSPILFRSSTPRTSGHDIPGAYNHARSVWIVGDGANGIPIVEASDADLLEITTKTKVESEVDDRRIAAQEGIALQGQKQSGKQLQAAPAVQRPSTGEAEKPMQHITVPSVESASPYGVFPILFDLPPAQETHNAISSFDGLDPLIDAWLSLHRRDAQDFARLRALAARIMQDRPARQILLQMEAEGEPEAQRIKQQANFQQQRGREGLMLAEQKR